MIGGQKDRHGVIAVFTCPPYWLYFVFVNKDIVISNPLVEASYNPASLNQLRILFACLLQVKAGEPIDVTKPFVVTAGGLADILGNEKLNNYGHLKAAVNDLYEWSMDIYKKPNGSSGEPDLIRNRVVDGIKYFDGEGRIELYFGNQIAPHISELKSFFTKVEARYLLPLKSGYSVRLYQIFLQTLMASGQSVVIKEYKVDEFRRQFALGKKYQKMKDMKRRIITPALEEINEKTDIRATFGQRSIGRKIVELQFEIRSKVRKKKPLAKPKKMSFDDYVKKHSNPGESWDQAKERLTVSYRKYVES